jgi:hypothetical protein
VRPQVPRAAIRYSAAIIPGGYGQRVNVFRQPKGRGWRARVPSRTGAARPPAASRHGPCAGDTAGRQRGYALMTLSSARSAVC